MLTARPLPSASSSQHCNAEESSASLLFISFQLLKVSFTDTVSSVGLPSAPCLRSMVTDHCARNFYVDSTTLSCPYVRLSVQPLAKLQLLHLRSCSDFAAKFEINNCPYTHPNFSGGAHKFLCFKV